LTAFEVGFALPVINWISAALNFGIAGHPPFSRTPAMVGHLSSSSVYTIGISIRDRGKPAYFARPATVGHFIFLIINSHPCLYPELDIRHI
jgi:hypothetical protein